MTQGIDEGEHDFPGYRILRVLGRGMGGTVYEAAPEGGGGKVALKAMATEGFLPGALDPRLAREAALLVRFPHPALVPLLGVDFDARRPFVVMALMEGGDLSRARLRVPEVRRIGARVASALAHLHGHGVVHRDVKPSNLLRDRAGEVYLADLGLGLQEGARRLTATGFVVGTPGFLAPEVLAGAAATPASDLYALGVTLAVLLGADPGEGGARGEELLEGLPADAPRELLRRLLRDHPRDRPGSAEEVAAALGGPTRTRAHRRTRPPARAIRATTSVGVAGGAAALLLAVAPAWLAWRARVPPPGPPPAAPVVPLAPETRAAVAALGYEVLEAREVAGRWVAVSLRGAAGERAAAVLEREPGGRVLLTRADTGEVRGSVLGVAGDAAIVQVRGAGGAALELWGGDGSRRLLLPPGAPGESVTSAAIEEDRVILAGPSGGPLVVSRRPGGEEGP